ncbi:MAG: hypothetical protein H6704_10815 [Myxococcales bacterium]|nr:hypothetical protein [Myxococcales bacterium]
MQVGGVAGAQIGRQRDHRGAVEDGVDRAQPVGTQREEVGRPEGAAAGRAADAARGVLDGGLEIALGEEGDAGQIDQLDADDAVEARGQEVHVAGLAAQGHQHRAAAAEVVGVGDQVAVGLGLMKADAALGPALGPERGVHACSRCGGPPP